MMPPSPTAPRQRTPTTCSRCATTPRSPTASASTPAAVPWFGDAPAGPASHRYPGQWGGDAESTVAGMQATVRGGLSYAVSAPGFWSHDIGGFFGPELTGPLYVRWTQFGALSPLMRAHGLRPREPWAFGAEVLASARTWVRRRYALLPYLWQVAAESAANGWPMMRPLDFHAPADRVGRGVDDAYLLGHDLYVVPDVQREPRPRWTASSGCRRAGGRICSRASPTTADATPAACCALNEMPVLAREGAVIPTVGITGKVRSTDDLREAPWDVPSLRTGRRTPPPSSASTDGISPGRPETDRHDHAAQCAAPTLDPIAEAPSTHPQEAIHDQLRSAPHRTPPRQR